MEILKVFCSIFEIDFEVIEKLRVGQEFDLERGNHFCKVRRYQHIGPENRIGWRFSPLQQTSDDLRMRLNAEISELVQALKAEYGLLGIIESEKATVERYFDDNRQPQFEVHYSPATKNEIEFVEIFTWKSA